MLESFIGSFFGAYIGTGGSPTLTSEVVYYMLDFVFFVIIGMSTLIYFKMFKIAEKEKVSEHCRITFMNVLMVLITMNVIFVSIMFEFIFIRKELQLYLPIGTRIIWLVLALVAMFFTVKAYFASIY